MEQDTYTTREAARVLQLTERRIAQMLERGELEGTKASGRWQIPQRAVHELLPDRPTRAGKQETKQTPEDVRELRARVENLQRDLGRFEGRLELEEVARSTLEAQLKREQERVDQERERAERESERAELAHMERVAAQEEAARLRQELEEKQLPWYKRWFS